MGAPRRAPTSRCGQRDWRNDVEGLAALFSNHIPDYRNLITSYSTLTTTK